ncbi:MAG: hypothetical protein ABI925_00455 [Verrucomicrobiota bacterium]
MTAPIETADGSVFDLSSRAKVRITGGDRLRFVNGQITNDVRKASEANAIEACILGTKGKLNAHVFISTGPDCFFVDADGSLREGLPVRLDRYVIADDVQIESLDEKLSIFHVLAPTAPVVDGDSRVISVRRFVESGWDVWIDSRRHDFVLDELSARFRFVDEVAAEVFRIEQGIPRWGRELTEDIIPIEANLESRTVDYEKGCYIGQEVISRIKMSGQTNKRLCGVLPLNNAVLSAGMLLAAEDKNVGWITSATRSGSREIALGYAKRGFNSIGTKLDALPSENPDAVRVPIEIGPLPFSGNRSSFPSSPQVA